MFISNITKITNITFYKNGYYKKGVIFIYLYINKLTSQNYKITPLHFFLTKSILKIKLKQIQLNSFINKKAA